MDGQFARQQTLHGQWSSPAYAEFDGQAQVIFAGGDGWLYSFDPDGADGWSELLWKFDCNPKTARYAIRGRSWRNHILATPVVYDGLVYIAVGEDPEHGERVGHLWCIDPMHRTDGSDVSAEFALDADGDILTPRRWQNVDEEEGERAVPNPDSAVVYIGNEEGGVIVFEHGAELNILAENDMLNSVYGTPIVANNVLYITNRTTLFAIGVTEE